MKYFNESNTIQEFFDSEEHIRRVEKFIWLADRTLLIQDVKTSNYIVSIIKKLLLMNTFKVSINPNNNYINETKNYKLLYFRKFNMSKILA